MPDRDSEFPVEYDAKYWLKIAEEYDGPVQLDIKRLARLCERLLELEEGV